MPPTAAMAPRGVEEADWTTSAAVYCDGPLLAAVQRACVWPDSKDFVDTPMRAAPSEVLRAFHAAAPSTDAEVRAFVARWFEPGPPQLALQPFPRQQQQQSSGGGGGGGDTAGGGDADSADATGGDRDALLPDWSPAGPPFAAAMPHGEVRDFARSVHALWPSLARAPTIPTSPSASATRPPPRPPPRSSLLPTPHAALVPGERFRETYYWDSHWVVLGLIASGMTSTAEGVVRNLLHLVSRHGRALHCLIVQLNFKPFVTVCPRTH